MLETKELTNSQHVATGDIQVEEEVQLPQEWFDRAAEAAARYGLPAPEITDAPEEVERNLRQFEQDDGQ